MVNPAAELADLVRALTQAGLMRGERDPKYSNATGMPGESQTELRPNVPRDASLQVNGKRSPRRSFAQITSCRCARTRSSNDTASLES